MSDFRDRSLSETNPLHYRTGGKETIDRIRESLRTLAQAFAGDPRLDDDESDFMGDLFFAAACEANRIKYTERAGKKGPGGVDLAKARWYAQMSHHVLDEDEPDPRSVETCCIEADPTLSLLDWLHSR